MLYKLVGGARVGKRWERALRQTGLSRWAARMGLTDSALNVEPACFCSLYEQTGLSIFLLKCSTPARADCAQLVLSTPQVGSLNPGGYPLNALNARGLRPPTKKSPANAQIPVLE